LAGIYLRVGASIQRVFWRGNRGCLGECVSDGERMDWRTSDLSNPFMERAIQLSIEGVQSGRGGPFGAVIVRDGKIIAEGSNEVTSTNDPTAHAEVLAIRRACEKLGAFELKDCELYTSCEPCPMCLGAIYWARLSRIYFASTAEDAAKAGFDDSFIYGELKQPLLGRRIPTIQMMREEALAGFRAWADRPDKIPY
jgi:guanine deaminase